MAPEYKLPEIKQKLIVHGHCHHKSIMKMDTEEALLKKMKADYRLLDDGCCGMAGAFGFEKDKYELSLQIGERVLLKEVRNAKDDELIIADGFSCKEQIRQTTNRKALHIAELVNMVINENKAKAKK
jgi:Fe-S oxidoreductase